MSAVRFGLFIVLFSILLTFDLVSTSSARDQTSKQAIGRYHPGTGSFIGKVSGESQPNQASVYVHGIERNLEFAQGAAFDVEGELMPVNPPSEAAAMIPFSAQMVLSFTGENAEGELIPSEAKFYHVKLRRDRF